MYSTIDGFLESTRRHKTSLWKNGKVVAVFEVYQDNLYKTLKSNYMKKLRIAFVWQGINGRYGHWNDGLKKAMELIATEHDVTYHEPSESIKDVDVILYWEAPCTILGKDKLHYLNILTNPLPKCLLFAGGPIKKEWIDGFDLVFIESQINADECEKLGVPHRTAFGVNTDIFFPQKLTKIYDGIHQATCASWKRLDLFAKALKEKGVVCGRDQETDPNGFIECRKQGVTLLPEQSYTAVANLLNQSHTMVQTSEFWGGGQRATLEAMSVGTPVICMSDSPKNCEFVEESEFGLVVHPEVEKIREAVEFIKNNPDKFNPEVGMNYIRNKFTASHYAVSILQGVKGVLENIAYL